MSPEQERKVFRAEHPRTQNVSLRFCEERVAAWEKWCKKRDLFLSDFIEDACQEACGKNAVPTQYPLVDRQLARTWRFPPEFVDEWFASAKATNTSLTDWMERVLCDKINYKG